MNILVFGSSILSSYWNGAATYYRGIYKELHRLGHRITFAEPDAYGRQQHLDFEQLPYVRSILYQPGDYRRILNAECRAADVVIKHSGIGVDDAALEEAVVESAKRNNAAAIFWDVDAPATLERVEADIEDPFRTLISRYDAVFTYGGGPPVIENYERLGATHCIPIYNALDPETHYPVPPQPEFACDLLFLGNRLPDRERRVEKLFLRAAALAPEMRFVLGGEGWEGKPMPANVRRAGHVPTAFHNKRNCSAKMLLNINRDSMAKTGFSPPTRVFEAAGSGACLLCDAWEGVEQFFEPEKEILVVRSAEQILSQLAAHTSRQAAGVGAAMRSRALRDHTYQRRAVEAEAVLRQLAFSRKVEVAR